MSLWRRAATVSLWTLLSRVLGLVRDRLWAGALGGSPVLDAFLVAYALPNGLRELFGEGALSAAFTPRYVQLRDRDPAAAERFAGAVLGRLAVLLTLICLAGMAVAALVAWLGAGRDALVATLALPMLPYLVLICLTAIGGGMLNARNVFWVPAAAPVLLNVIMITTVWMSPDREAQVLPWAVLLAGIAQLALVWWALRRSGGMPRWRTAPDPEERELRGAFLPVLLSSSVYQVNALIGQVLVLILVPGAGAVAFVYFANRLLQFPLALITHGVTTASYADLARAAAVGWAEAGASTRAAASLMAFWLLPAAVGLIVVAEPLVRAIYQNGTFQEDAVARTVLVTRLLGLALIPISLNKLYVRVFNAARAQRVAMRVTLLAVAVNVIASVILLLTPLREAGLALATALSSTVASACYVVLLRQRGAGAVFAWRAWARPLAGALAMGVAVWALLHWWRQPEGGASAAAALRLGAAVALGGALYLAIAGARRRHS